MLGIPVNESVSNGSKQKKKKDRSSQFDYLTRPRSYSDEADEELITGFKKARRKMIKLKKNTSEMRLEQT